MNTTFTPASNKKQISQPIKILLILIILVLIVAGIYLISQTPHIKSFIQGTYQNIVFQIQSYKPTPTQQTPITLSNSKDKQKVTQQLLSS